LIPKSRLESARSAIKNSKNTENSTVGYEVFDSHSIVTSPAVQRINQKRAKEGELARTLNSIRGVKSSRIHLAIPEKSLFLEEQKKTTASVVLDWDGDSVSISKKISGIAQLLSHAIEGLDSKNITIVDSSGTVLWGSEAPVGVGTQEVSTPMNKIEAKKPEVSSFVNPSQIDQRETLAVSEKGQEILIGITGSLFLFAGVLFFFRKNEKTKKKSNESTAFRQGIEVDGSSASLGEVRDRIAQQLQKKPQKIPEILQEWLDQKESFNPQRFSSEGKRNYDL